MLVKFITEQENVAEYLERYREPAGHPGGVDLFVYIKDALNSSHRNFL